MILSLLFLGFLLGILSKSALCMGYALQAIRIWTNSMMPALLPFMILSGIMIRMNMTEKIASFLFPFFKRLFDCSKAGCYCILIGFLCGFPMGAKTISDLRQKLQISEEESRRLLSFCNNIGPSYMIGFAIPLLKIKYPALCLLVFYGIPFLYGIFLCHAPKTKHSKKKHSDTGYARLMLKEESQDKKNLLGALEDAVTSSMKAIMVLGGYLILFCVLNLIPHWIFGAPAPCLGPVIEITSGLQNLHGERPIYCLVMLSFGGLCCIAQTHASLQNGKLTKYLGEYTFHKSIQAALTLGCFLMLTRLVPDFFQK